MRNNLYVKWRMLEWISLLGDSLYYLALLSYASRLPNPAIAIMIVSLSESIPNFFQIVLGVFADATLQRTKRFFQSGIVRGVIYILIGLIIFYTDSIYGLLLIGILNIFGDLFGKYVRLCIDPFIKFIVPEKQMEKALSLNIIVTSSISMVANFLGAAIISFTGMYQLAWINAATFFIVSVGIQWIRSELENIEKKIVVEKQDSFKKVFQHIVSSLTALLKMQEMKYLFFIAAGLNSIAVTIVPICSMFLAYHSPSRIFNTPFSIALIQALIMLSGILGSLFGAAAVKELSTRFILMVAFAGNLMFVLLLFFNRLWLGVLFLLLSIFVTSIFNLKFSSDIIRTVPAEKMGTLYGCMDTFFLVVPSVVAMGFMGCASLNFRLYLGVVAIFCLSFMVLIFRIKLIYKS